MQQSADTRRNIAEKKSVAGIAGDLVDTTWVHKKGCISPNLLQSSRSSQTKGKQYIYTSHEKACILATTTFTRVV